MKKFLLSLAAVAMASAAMAGTATFDFVNNAYTLSNTDRSGSKYDKEFTITVGDVTMTATQATGNGFRLWTDGLRLYGGTDAFTLSAKDASITKVVISYAASPGTLAVDGVAVAISSNVSTWEGKAAAPEFVYTVTSNKAIKTIEVTYETNLSGDQKPAGLAFDAATATVIKGEAFTAPEFSNPNNLPVTWNSTNPAVATVADGVVTILADGTTTIEATSAATEEFGTGYASYTLTVVNAAANIADLLENCTVKGDKLLVNFDMTVVYVNGANVYVKDAEGNATLIYQSTTYAKGDVIPAGWVATYSPYAALPEFTMSETPEAKANVEVTYDTLESVSMDDVNKVVWLNGVTFADATPDAKANFEGTLANGDNVAFRNNFTVASVDAGTYNVLCAVSRYNADLQVMPIEYKVGPKVGVEIVAAEADAVYYNLNGVKVANPTNGVFVKVVNGKAVKVVK